MVQSLDRSQGRAGGIGRRRAPSPTTFTGNRALQIEEPLDLRVGQPSSHTASTAERRSKLKDRLNVRRRTGRYRPSRA